MKMMNCENGDLLSFASKSLYSPQTFNWTKHGERHEAKLLCWRKLRDNCVSNGTNGSVLPFSRSASEPEQVMAMCEMGLRRSCKVCAAASEIRLGSRIPKLANAFQIFRNAMQFKDCHCIVIVNTIVNLVPGLLVWLTIPWLHTTTQSSNSNVGCDARFDRHRELTFTVWSFL